MFVSVIWITSVLTAFSLRTFSRDVKVVQSYINNEYTTVTEIISFLFSFFVDIGDNHGTVLECTILHNASIVALS